MSETNKNNDSTKPKKPSIRHLKNMSYMEILENYAEYPQKNLKFNYLSASLKDGNAYSTASESGQKVHLVFDGVKVNKAKFLSALAWFLRLIRISTVFSSFPSDFDNSKSFNPKTSKIKIIRVIFVIIKQNVT